MIVANDKTWCLITPPKTASSMLSELFARPQFDAGLATPDVQHDTTPVEDARVLAAVRSPYTRAVSLWRHRLYSLSKAGCSPNDLSFKRYMRQILDGDDNDSYYSFNLSEWLKWCRLIDGTIRFEALHEDLAEEFPQFDWSQIKLPWVNKNPVITNNHPLAKARWCRPVTRLPDPLTDLEAQDLVIRWADEDFDRFNYPTTYTAGP